MLSGSGTATIGGESASLGRRARRPSSRAGNAWQVDDADELVVLSVLVEEPLPPDGTTHAVVDLAAERDARRDGRPPVPAARDARGRLRVGDAVRRLHPGRPGARPLPQVRRGRLRARRRGRAAHRRRVGTAPRPARASTCLLGSCTASRTWGPARCSVLGVFRPAGSPAEAYYPDGTPAGVPSQEEDRDAEDRAHRRHRWDGNLARGAGTISAETGAFSGLGYSLRDANRRSGGEDEPRGAARRGARRLPDHEPRRRADRSRHPARASRRRRAGS